jgi:hypothetical protein
MVDSVSSFRDVIGLWDSQVKMGADIGARPPLISKWRERDNIPSEWWERILATETARAAGVTAELLTRLAAKQLEEART